MRLHVNNFSFDVTDDELRELFEPFGVVTDCYLILDRETRRSRGFGFVEMPNADEAQAAIEALDLCQWCGRRLHVNEARGRAA
jgi:RNA recognition motif-containing protein